MEEESSKIASKEDYDVYLAKEYMAEKIGKSHRFRKITETETVLE